MDLVPCPHCDMLVSVGDDGICPSCRKSVDQPPDKLSTATSGLTIPEQIYKAFVILYALLLMMSVAVFHLLIIPKSDNPGVLYFVTAILWIAISTLAVTVGCNLWNPVAAGHSDSRSGDLAVHPRLLQPDRYLGRILALLPT